MTKKQMVDGTKPLPEGVSGTIRVINFDAVVHGDVAVATYVDDEDETFHGHKLHCQYRTTDTWLKTAKGWRLIASQALALRTDPPPVALADSLRAAYCGRYALTPSITYEIRCSGDSLRWPADRTEAGGAAHRGAGRPLRARTAALPIRLPPGRQRQNHRLRSASRGVGPRLETNAAVTKALIGPPRSTGASTIDIVARHAPGRRRRCSRWLTPRGTPGSVRPGRDPSSPGRFTTCGRSGPTAASDRPRAPVADTRRRSRRSLQASRSTADATSDVSRRGALRRSQPRRSARPRELARHRPGAPRAGFSSATPARRRLPPSGGAARGARRRAATVSRGSEPLISDVRGDARDRRRSIHRRWHAFRTVTPPTGVQIQLPASRTLSR